METGRSELLVSDRMAAFATYHNQHMVKYDHYSVETDDYDPWAVRKDFAISCDGYLLLNQIQSTASIREDEYYESESRVAEELVEGWMNDGEYRETILDATDKLGTDAYADADGSVFFTTHIC